MRTRVDVERVGRLGLLIVSVTCSTQPGIHGSETHPTHDVMAPISKAPSV